MRDRSISETVANVAVSEAEITSVMVDAGKEALCGVSLIDDDWASVVIEVYSRMQAARELQGRR